MNLKMLSSLIIIKRVDRGVQMSQEEKSVEELLKDLHEIDKRGKMEIRKLPIDGFGNLLLDGNNPDDSEWYQNDENYDLIYEEEKPS